MQNKNVCHVAMGQYVATKELNTTFKTILGSCVAVCLKDYKNKVAGINHYFYPQMREGSILEPGKYGNKSIPLLLNEMISMGAELGYIQAKLYGGSAVNNGKKVAFMNIRLAYNILAKNNIPVIDSDTGGERGRVITFYPYSFEVIISQTKEVFTPIKG